MKFLFSPPTLDDFIRLLKAWRFWSVGALIGGLIGVAVYFIAPPPYRAHATVLVDFNLEQAWPKETDRQQFYYLERESRKLEEIAWSDSVMQAVVALDPSITVQELRDGKLSISQPAEGGWKFYVKDNDPGRAVLIASTWAQAFAEQAHAQIATQSGLNSYIQVNVTQSASLPVERSVSLSLYLFVGAVVFLAFGSIVVLFVSKPK